METRNLYEDVTVFLQKLSATNSRLEKEKILKEYSEHRDLGLEHLLCMVYNYDRQFYITSANLKKKKDLVLSEDEKSYIPDNIFDLLYLLIERTITGHQAIKIVNSFINEHLEYEELFYKIIDKDLKVGVGADIIKKYFSDVKTFDVQLADDYEDKLKKNIQDGFISHKLDGVRCLAIFDNNGIVNLISRQGKPFNTLDVLKQELENLGLVDTVLDGEVCLMDENGKEDFQGIMKEIRRKDHTIKNPMFLVFDEICKTAFDNKFGTNVYSFRYQGLDKIRNMSNHIKVLEQVPFTDDNFEMMKKKSEEGDWEGLIIRANSVYEGKRTKKMLKYKLFYEAEYTVDDIEINVKPMLNENGIMEPVKRVCTLFIHHKGDIVGVGSGIKDKESVLWFEQPDLILGKTITVRYTLETEDKNGSPSLRFARLKHVWENGRDV